MWFGSTNANHVRAKELLAWNRELMTLSKTELLLLVMQLRIEKRRLEVAAAERSPSDPF